MRFGAGAVLARTALALAMLFACSTQSTPTAPVSRRTLDLGDGVTATLGSDGRLVISRGDAVLASSLAEVPVFSQLLDETAPEKWHDPAHFEASSLTRVLDAAIVFEVAAPGVLHLQVAATEPAAALTSMALGVDEGVFYTGLGERFDHVGALGQVVPMHLSIDASSASGTNERHVPVPLLVAAKAGAVGSYGVFIKSREAGAFDVGKTDPKVARGTFEGRGLDVYVYVAPTPALVISAFVRQTGLPRPLPRWALGPMLWRNEWTSGDELLADAAELRKRHIPTTTLWIDNPWQVSYNDFTIDPKRFPNAPAMMDQLKKQGFRVIAWSTPYLERPQGAPVTPAQSLFVAADASGYFVKLRDGATFIAPGFNAKQGFGMLDFTSDGARRFWSGHAGVAVALGVSGFKLDYAEDAVPQILGARTGLVFADGSTERSARAYPLAYHRAYHDSLDAAGGGVLIVRASSFGGATVADVVWPGDLESNFSHANDLNAKGLRGVGGLPASVVAAQTLAVSGFPSFGADTGGFRGTPTREALLRWAEQTALSVILQLGGGGVSHNPWMYDEEASTIYAGLARLHMQLEPYLSGLLARAETFGEPTIVPLPVAYPSDLDGWAFADDEYLLGPDFLVAPIVTEGATGRSVHLPPGRWVQYWEGARFDGPQTLNVAAPLGQPPLFVRAGALVPMLAFGIDTLEPATDSATVSATTRTEVFARAWPAGNRAAARYDDGATVSTFDDASGTQVDFGTGTLAGALEISVDLRSRMKAGVSRVSVGGVALPVLPDAAALRAAAGSGCVLRGDEALVRLVGGGSARIE